LSELPPPLRFHSGRYQMFVVGVSAFIIAVFIFWPPFDVLDKAHAIGYAICHQLPARTIHINNHPLPLCARCTGIYLGTLMTLVGLTLSRRCYMVGFPPTYIMVLLVAFIGLMGVDGINSYLSFFPKAPHLYEPQNWLRLTTGTFHGLAISMIVFPVINGGLWRSNYLKNEPVIKNFKELLPFLAGAVVIIFGTLAAEHVWPNPIWLYTLTILSTLGVLLMLSMVNTMLVIIVTRREGCALTWRDLAGPAIIGLALTFLMIGGMGWLRATLSGGAHLPF
jgi:uncharacterized membrane protein